MAQNTNLNVTPYYDDFDKSKNFYRVLFRPGFPIQARELSTMQSIMQNQVENIGSHTFKDGAMVIPGQVGYDLNVDCIMLQESFLGADVENYRSQLDGKIITGLTSGVKAKVLYSISATQSDKSYITIYVKYIESGGTALNQDTFSNNEQLITESEITFGTTLIEVGSPFAQLLPTAAIQTGSVAYVQSGVYFIRGFFVDVPYQYILLDQYGTSPKYRIGLEILESIVTPEDDLSLNDNAAGTSNYAAPGAHRFRVTTNLIKKLLTDDADKDFIELLRLNGNKVEKIVDRSAYDELEKSLALRTFEENGDYVVKDFQISMRENLNDGFNNGVYSIGDVTSGGATATESNYSVEIGPGIAYVRGYRVKTTAPTYIDLAKPRETDSAQNTNIAFELGNWSTIENLFGFPNVAGSTITNAYQTLELRDTLTASAGTAAGNLIGYARVASCEYVSNPDTTFGNTDDRYKLNLFDVQMVTTIQLNSAKTIAQGSIVVGATTGARGYLIDAVTAATHINLYQVEGTFAASEYLLLDGEQLDTITNVHTYKYSDTRQIVGKDEGTTAVEFTCDVRLEDALFLQGATFTYDATGGSEKITGLNSNFASDLRPGDRIYFSETKYVDVDFVDPTNLASSNVSTIFNYQAQTVNVTPGAGGAAPTAGTYTVMVRYRSKLNQTENADLFSALTKPYVKSISDESMVCRRTFDAQTVASSSISITLPENEQFEPITDQNYTITVLGSTNGTYPAGDQIPIDIANSGALGYTSFTSSERTTIQIDNLTNISSVKVTATISKNVTQRKTKALQKMFILKVNKTTKNLDKINYGLTYSNLYGTRIQDKDVSLGLVDSYKVHAVYESLDDSDPVIPSVTLVEPIFFAVGTVVTGRTSKARATVVDFNSSTLKLTIVYLSGAFTSGETVNGFNTAGAAISGIINDSVGSVVAGSKVITDRYIVDNGQTPFMYTCARLTRKKGFVQPIRKLKVVIDYYSHSATGDYFGGQSYLETDYKNINIFENRFMADFLDFRPGVKNLYTGTGTVASPAYVNCSTFDFKSRVFPTSGTPAATLFDIPKLNSNFKCDFDWYLARIDKLYLLPNGKFQIIKGKSSENPSEPDNLNDGMLLGILRHAPYGFNPNKDVSIAKSDHKRFTMRDIGALEKRLDQVEYFTSLNMLETDTFNIEVTDASGKNRLKNGFLVDDFTDHSKSNLKSEDWGASLDFREGVARPSHFTTNVSLIINETLSQNYQKTGPVVTLPYTEEALITQPYASRTENVNPFNVFTYIGRIDLTPASDDWVDTNRLPEAVQSIEGDFRDTTERLNTDQNGFAGTQWASWETTWTGSGTRESLGRRNTSRRSDWGGGLAVDETTRITVPSRQTRAGVRTRVVPRIDRISQGDTVVSRTSTPWIRSRNIDVSVVRMKPRTSFFSFFDGQSVNDYFTPKIIELIKDSTTDARTNSTPFVVGETVTGLTSGCKLKVAAPDDYYKFNPYDDTELASSYSSTTAFLNIDTVSLAAQATGTYYGNMQVGEVLLGTSGARAVVRDRRFITDRRGQYRGTLFIPPANVDTNPRWATGTRVLRFTTSATDSRTGGTVSSSAQADYQATGTLETIQENILAVRNADVVTDTVTQTESRNTVRTETRQVGWYDPLAQSFIIDEEGGSYVTSVDVYFNAKDANIPISMQIRSMENGYPTTSILPFSDTTLNPDNIQISETGSIATKFTFQAPVYIPQSQEHCFVLLSDSNSYQVWISRMGELDITGDRTISEQPYAGVLFKSQNASTWTADQYEDMKFIVNRAVFNTSVNSQLVLNNASLDRGNGGQVVLQTDAIQTFQPELQLVMNANNLPYTVGSRLYQKTTNAEGTVTSVGSSGSAVLLTINDISGTWAAGSNTGGVISNRVVSSKALATMVVTGASGDFTVGETITGNSATAPTAEVVTWTAGTNTLTLKYVSTDFTASTETITGALSSKTATVGSITYSGDTIVASAVADAFVGTSPTYTSSQRKIRVFHSNHAMHDLDNNVIISGIESEVTPTYLTSAIAAGDTSLQVNDASAFHKIINGVAISASNVAYIKINDEIMSYSAISNDGKTITVYERGVSGTAVTQADESIVECYNLDGIPLTELNKTHTALQTPTLDSYDLVTTSIAIQGIKSGGSSILASQNIQYEYVTPSIQKVLLPNTDMTGRVNSISGTSINNGVTLSQNSFSNNGKFYDVLINRSNEFISPQLICSNINESTELGGAKSFRLDLNLTSTDSNVSPIIDTDRMSIILTSNRINNPSNVDSAKLPVGDEHEAAYITKIADLTNPSSSIKLIFSGYRPPDTLIKPLYRVLPSGSTDSIEKYGFEFFPTNDATIPNTTELEEYREYDYEVSGLDFTQYQIKVLFVSANQASIPRISDLRAIALAI